MWHKQDIHALYVLVRLVVAIVVVQQAAVVAAAACDFDFDLAATTTAPRRSR